MQYALQIQNYIINLKLEDKENRLFNAADPDEILLNILSLKLQTLHDE